jgi:hypothetical protein
MPFFPISSLFSKINARNINYMAVLNFRKCLDLRKNCYNPTASYMLTLPKSTYFQDIMTE